MNELIARLKQLHDFYKFVDFRTCDIANYCHVSSRVVRSWLSGKSEPTPRHMKRLERYMHRKGKETNGKA